MVGLRQYSNVIARRVLAAERVVLRRWLRKNAPRDDNGQLPGHMYLIYNRDQLVDLVIHHGGDSEKLLKRAKDYAIDKIVKGE